ncbi:NADPH:quinone reductase; Zinc-containing alcohol dehydrogenase superfamily [Cupriavidus taiwanensis]|uniref:NADPH:quinone reductase Zinc-containing alcohol dehydrogenase superfamily n=1 Tax=Cupriavidus taiwanensis TaxID=164546 RepID=A0A375C771_9BURK|nr:NADP-dependent oxidoreductase [Cupriavidus taiwanensis]SOY63925.1 NADPH:quinone reductase; Zinc-containing alcohol dehydrogenase superfamily [Cupriavidus taiwanensis]
MEQNMRAVLIDRHGGPEVIRLGEVARPEPAAGEVLIRVACAGVNPADWKCREGYLSAFMQASFPFVLGFDASGVVAAVGAGVTAFVRGQRVFAQTGVGAGQWGSYAQYVAVGQDCVVPMPDHLQFAEAAAVPTPALAAWTGLFDDGGLRPGQTVLVHGGAGAVGTFAVQLARAAGATVAATCSAAHRDALMALGCDLAIDYRASDIGAAVRAWAPAGVDLVLDAVGCGTLPMGLDLLRPGGILVAILTLASGDHGPDHAEAARRGVRTAVAFSKMPSGARLGEIAALLNDRRLRPPRIECLPLAQAGQALELVRSGQAASKLVLCVDGPGNA